MHLSKVAGRHYDRRATLIDCRTCPCPYSSAAPTARRFIRRCSISCLRLHLGCSPAGIVGLSSNRGANSTCLPIGDYSRPRREGLQRGSRSTDRNATARGVKRGEGAPPMAGNGWLTPFDEPIVLDDGTKLATLRDAIHYLVKTVP